MIFLAIAWEACKEETWQIASTTSFWYGTTRSCITAAIGAPGEQVLLLE